MEPQTAFVGTDCGVELDTESTVDLNLALIVHPGNPELNETLRLHNAIDDAGFDQLRFLFHDGLEGFENFLDRLKTKLQVKGYVDIAQDAVDLRLIKDPHEIKMCRISGELVDLGVKLDLVQKSGSWFSMGETRIGQGRDAAKKYLEENPDIAADVEAQIRANFDKLMGNQSRIAAAKAAGKAVNVSADDFDDED